VNESFSKSFRITHRHDFESLKNNPYVVKGKELICFSRKNSYQHSRMATAFSRKTGNAIYRNLLRRKIKESFRKSDIKSLGIDLLLHTNKSINRLDFTSFDEIVNKLFFKIKSHYELDSHYIYSFLSIRSISTTS